MMSRVVKWAGFRTALSGSVFPTTPSTDFRCAAQITQLRRAVSAVRITQPQTLTVRPG